MNKEIEGILLAILMIFSNTLQEFNFGKSIIISPLFGHFKILFLITSVYKTINEFKQFSY